MRPGQAVIEVGVLVVPSGPDYRSISKDNLVGLDTFLVKADLWTFEYTRL